MTAIVNTSHRYLLASLITSIALTGCGGGGGGGDSPKARTDSSYNLNGDWTITERVKSITCPNDEVGVGDEFSEVYQIIQNNASVTVTSEGKTVLAGEINGSRLQLAGIYTDTEGGFKITTKADVTVMTNDRFNGTETAVFEMLDKSDSCTLVTSYDGNRVGSATRAAIVDDTNANLDATPDGDTPELSEALPLHDGVSVTSTVNSSGNQFDIYRIDVSANNTLAVSLDGFTDTGSNLDLLILNDEGVQLAESETTADSAESINYNATESTTLYVVVKAQDTGSQDINFNLRASVQ